MRRAGTVIAVGTLLASTAPLAAVSNTSSAASAATPGPLLRAVVSVHRGVQLPLRPATGRVLHVYRHVGAELVAAPHQALAALASDPAVAGISGDWRGSVAGLKTEKGKDHSGVLAPDVVGGTAGEPGVGAGVTVALLDTGVSDTAAINRASGRLIDGVDVTHLGEGNDGTPKGPLTDGYGHGTFMASLIAGGRVPGSGGRALGIAPAAHVVVVKVAGSRGMTSLSRVLAGLDWVATHASSIQVVNLSLAVQRASAPKYGSDPLTAAVEDVRAAGVLVVAAAGNVPNQIGDPGIDPQALTVGAADNGPGRPRAAGFSGSAVVAGVVKPDVVAPGVHVLGAMAPNTLIAQRNPQAWDGHGLFRGSGTSEASAVTSGAAAAYLSSHPGATPLTVKTALRAMAHPLCTWGTGAGLVQLTPADSVCKTRKNHSGVTISADPTGEATFNASSWQANSWLNGAWVPWLASSWSASSWSASSWSASSWSASSWSASSWSASSWSDAGWGG